MLLSLPSEALQEGKGRRGGKGRLGTVGCKGRTRGREVGNGEGGGDWGGRWGLREVGTGEGGGGEGLRISTVIGLPGAVNKANFTCQRSFTPQNCFVTLLFQDLLCCP